MSDCFSCLFLSIVDFASGKKPGRQRVKSEFAQNPQNEEKLKTLEENIQKCLTRVKNHCKGGRKKMSSSSAKKNASNRNIRRKANFGFLRITLLWNIASRQPKMIINQTKPKVVTVQLTKKVKPMNVKINLTDNKTNQVNKSMQSPK